MQSGLGDDKFDLRRAFVRVESGLTKRCQVLKESSNGERVIVLFEDDSHSIVVSTRHVWLEKSSDLSNSACEVCFFFGNLLQCRYCGRRFHEMCSCMPEAKVLGATASPTFTCRDCFFMHYASLKGSEKAGFSKNSITFIKEVKKYRTYAYRELRWDGLRRFNRTAVYCYCGGPGHFSKRMLQCIRCFQWFHRACLHCLSPDRDLLPWDCFWYFKCALCNGEFGEVGKQLPIVWTELLHLALMNLCLRRNDFCNVKNDIMPWLADNWKHISPDKSVSLAYETAESIEEKLKSDPARFQCAREVDGEALNWRPRCSLSGPLRPDLTCQCPADVPISQNDLDKVSFTRQTSVCSLSLLTLQSSAALPSPEDYKTIYGSSDAYRQTEERLRTSCLTDYNESEMTLINDYRPDEDTSAGSAYRLAAAGSKRRRCLTPTPPPPKPPRSKRRKVARKVRRGPSEAAKRDEVLWELSAEEDSAAQEVETSGAILGSPAAAAASEEEAAKSASSFEHEMPEKEKEQTPVEKKRKVRRASGAEEKKGEVANKRNDTEDENERPAEDGANSFEQSSPRVLRRRSKLKSELSVCEKKDTNVVSEDSLLVINNVDKGMKDEKVRGPKVNCDSLAHPTPPPKNAPLVDDLSSKVPAHLNSVLSKMKNVSRDSSIDSPLAVSSGGEYDARSASESFTQKKRQVARKSTKKPKRTSSPLLAPAQARSSIRTRECSVALHNVHNWYEITGDQPPHTCASGSHVLRNIPSYTLASSVDKNAAVPFAYRWEVNSRPRYSRLKTLNRWPTRHSLSTTMTRAAGGGGKRTFCDLDGGLATVFARRRPMLKKRKDHDMELSSNDDSVVKVVSKGTFKKLKLNCDTTVLPIISMDDDNEADPNYEILLRWNPKMIRMDTFS